MRPSADRDHICSHIATADASEPQMLSWASGRAPEELASLVSHPGRHTRLPGEYPITGTTRNPLSGRTIHVDRGEQGRRRTLVHRVLGQGLQPRCHRRSRRSRHPLRILAARPLPWPPGSPAVRRQVPPAFPDLNFWGTADLIAEGDYVVGQWEGGGTHTGPAFDDFLIGGLTAATGRRMHFTGTTVLKVINGKIMA